MTTSSEREQRAEAHMRTELAHGHPDQPGSDAEYRRRGDAITERNGRAGAMEARPSDDGATSAMVEVRGE